MSRTAYRKRNELLGWGDTVSTLASNAMGKLTVSKIHFPKMGGHTDPQTARRLLSFFRNKLSGENNKFWEKYSPDSLSVHIEYFIQQDVMGNTVSIYPVVAAGSCVPSCCLKLRGGNGDTDNMVILFASLYCVLLGLNRRTRDIRPSPE
jgi:hypothetical protein